MSLPCRIVLEVSCGQFTLLEIAKQGPPGAGIREVYVQEDLPFVSRAEPAVLFRKNQWPSIPGLHELWIFEP